MIKNQRNVIRAMHEVFKAVDDIDAAMFAIEGIMTGHWIIWRQKVDALFHSNRFGLTYSEVIMKHVSIRALFEYEVNTVAMNKRFYDFEELCELCMDFTIFASKAKNDELKIVGPY